MNGHVKRFYQQTHESPNFENLFYEVLFLEKGSKLSIDKLQEMAPALPKGWYELSQLKREDRIGFTLEYWLDILPFHPKGHKFLEQFFANVDDIGIYLTKDHPKSYFQPEFVYSIREDRSFFRGFPPASESTISSVNQTLLNRIPRDFLNFNRIHNGFKKHMDTGILMLEDMPQLTEKFHQILLESERVVTCKKSPIDPLSLLPFYECFGLHSYQCFFLDWYPVSTVGNVYFSGVDFTISDYTQRKDSLAFFSFFDWLMFYLEQMEI